MGEGGPSRVVQEATQPHLDAFGSWQRCSHALGLQIAQCRPYLHTFGPKVGIIYIHEAPGMQCSWHGMTVKVHRIPFETLLGLRGPESLLRTLKIDTIVEPPKRELKVLQWPVRVFCISPTRQLQPSQLHCS